MLENALAGMVAPAAPAEANEVGEPFGDAALRVRPRAQCLGLSFTGLLVEADPLRQMGLVPFKAFGHANPKLVPFLDSLATDRRRLNFRHFAFLENCRGSRPHSEPAEARSPRRSSGVRDHRAVDRVGVGWSGAEAVRKGPRGDR